ncbi:hypothetical protein [Gordonia aquimaris]|uniref:Uncharacterized protein n=1 Tax=Gordonia aquimaris TaxID=2984863 RepID=A0A9X3D802_9ACTN|nr:hypothetical protein [Gordonia aquimaris]MCX2966860.1 hypothetical protein [Gordonia aquimaris]
MTDDGYRDDARGALTPGIIELPRFLSPACSLVSLRVRRVAGGVALEQAIEVDDRIGWQRQWVWRFVSPTASDGARPSTLDSIAATLAELTEVGCTVGQITTVTGCHWPTTIVDGDVDGLIAACLGRGWTLWPHPVDPATPGSSFVWRVTTGIDGCRFAVGEDEYVIRAGGAERVLVPNTTCIYRFDGPESSNGNANPIGWGSHVVENMDSNDPSDRNTLLGLLHRWIPLRDVAEAIDARYRPIDPAGLIDANVDGGCRDATEDDDRIVIEVPGDRRDEVRRFCVTKADYGWSLGVHDGDEWSEVHRWADADNSDAMPRNVVVHRQTTATVAEAVRSALIAGATASDLCTFTGDVWPTLGHTGMLDGFAAACTGYGWCPWPLAPRRDSTDIGCMWSACIVDGNRYVVDSVERVVQLGGIRAVEASVGGRSLMWSSFDSLPGLAGRAHILEGFRPGRAEHWSALLAAVRTGALADGRLGVTACGGFVALAAESI